MLGWFKHHFIYLFVSHLSNYKRPVTNTVSWVKHLEGLGIKRSTSIQEGYTILSPSTNGPSYFSLHRRNLTHMSSHTETAGQPNSRRSNRRKEQTYHYQLQIMCVLRYHGARGDKERCETKQNQIRFNQQSSTNAPSVLRLKKQEILNTDSRSDTEIRGMKVEKKQLCNSILQNILQRKFPVRTKPAFPPPLSLMFESSSISRCSNEIYDCLSLT